MAQDQTPYAAHRAFVAPAWPRRELWRIGVMIVGFELAFDIAPQLVAALLPNDAVVASYYEGVSKWATLLQLATFGVTALLFVLLLRRVHGRGFWSLIGAPGRALTDLRQVTIAVGGILLLLEILPPWIGAGDGIEMRNIAGWLVTIPLVLVVLIIQVGTEEIYFRGYLQQQFACLSRARLVWMLAPSLMFGVSHYANGDGVADGVLWAVWATILGMACADLTARTGTLGAAIGLHLANNLFALLIVGINGWPSSGLALFVYPALDRSSMDTSAAMLATPEALFELTIMCLTVLIMWLSARITLRR
jgi:membrane protease YdiL (CAAX protease family)